MSKKVTDISGAEKDLSLEERARRAAYRISKKYENNHTDEPEQAAAGKTTKDGEMDHDDSEE